MKLWLIERDWKLVDYDETIGLVIRAETEEQVRRLARRRSWDHSKDWLDPKRAKCQEITTDGPVRTLLQANHRG